MRAILASLLVLSAAVAGCQSTIHHAVMEPEELDYGTIPLEERVSKDLTFTNPPQGSGTATTGKHGS